MTELEMGVLRDRVARVLFQEFDPAQSDERAPWQEPRWREAAERCIKEVLAVVRGGKS